MRILFHRLLEEKQATSSPSIGDGEYVRSFSDSAGRIGDGEEEREGWAERAVDPGYVQYSFHLTVIQFLRAAIYSYSVFDTSKCVYHRSFENGRITIELSRCKRK